MSDAPQTSDPRWLRKTLIGLYEGVGKGPYIFRLALLAFDIVTIGYFLWAPFQDSANANPTLDYVIGAVIALDLAARFYIARTKRRFWTKIVNWADLIVVLTMFAPIFTQNFAFLRLLRAVRIIRALTLFKRMKGVSGYLKEREAIFDRVTNLIVFMFMMAAVVYVQQVDHPDSDINNYIDALYFTVTSLTTTGYGDILMQGVWGRVLAIIIMVLGLTLFLRLLREVARPNNKVTHDCETCGLTRHDPDAVHCKHCGEVVRIQTMGQT